MKKIYNKLVRDGFEKIYNDDIEQKISMSGYVARHLSKQETVKFLKVKLNEEVDELKAAQSKEELQEEIADVLEVLDAIASHNTLSMVDIIRSKDEKRIKKGGFETGLFLESIDYIDK